MPMRTRSQTVTFRRSFVLDGLDEVLPAGSYSIETDEELLEVLSFAAYRRTSTRIHLAAKPARPGIARTLIVDPKALDAAVRRDQATAALSVGRDRGRQTLERVTTPRHGADRHAIERGEAEGMAAHPKQATGPVERLRR